MKKRSKWLIAIALILLLPFLILGVNMIYSWYNDSTYKELSKGVSSSHFLLNKINLSGKVVTQEANTTVIDSLYVDTIKLDKKGNIDSLYRDPPTYITYNGHVYLDTVQLNFLVESSVENEGSHIVTLTPHGKTLSMVKVVNHNEKEILRSCILLENMILPFQPWLDPKQPLYLAHFSKQKFDTSCFNPLRGMGSPNGSGPCYFWEGEGYYNMVIAEEVLKFKLPLVSSAIFFSNNDDFPSYTMDFSVVPERFRDKVNACFLIYDDDLFMARKK